MREISLSVGLNEKNYILINYVISSNALFRLKLKLKLKKILKIKVVWDFGRRWVSGLDSLGRQMDLNLGLTLPWERPLLHNYTEWQNPNTKHIFSLSLKLQPEAEAAELSKAGEKNYKLDQQWRTPRWSRRSLVWKSLRSRSTRLGSLYPPRTSRTSRKVSPFFFCLVSTLFFYLIFSYVDIVHFLLSFFFFFPANEILVFNNWI